MSLIYEPQGAAREYSPYALNLYMGCVHRCAYCFAPHTIQKSAKDYSCVPHPRRAVQEGLLKELSRFRPQKQVLLSFIGDVYGETADNNALTRWTLQVLQEHNVPVAILTKAGNRIAKDIDVIGKFGNRIQVGASLTFYDEDDSRKWEPGAAMPLERVEALRYVHGCGIATFASFEPVIDPAQSLRLMEIAMPYVDTFKIGKLNRHPGAEGVDWAAFLETAMGILRAAGKRIYIKQSLRQAAPGVRLFGNECLPDEHCVPFGGV
jgi:DNA repair photolyase